MLIVFTNRTRTGDHHGRIRSNSPILLLLLRPLNGIFPGQSGVNQHQKGKPLWILLEHARDDGGGSGVIWTIMEIICTSLQTENHASTSPFSLYRPNALSAILTALVLLWPLCGRGHAIIFSSRGFFLLSSFFLAYSQPSHIGGLKCAARDCLKIQDAKKIAKIAICAPSHNFVGLYLRN